MKKYLGIAAVMAALVASSSSPASAFQLNAYGRHICNDVPFIFQTGIQSLVCFFAEN
ncbi:hypothetical protein [Rhizobium halophytocola]|uniref:DUF992 domain-containing protein n=1 Tax=Rhizobium halophytocola TaxID=735519 RepID=A0ABS4E4D2_9HYPH|nr:hypothetical protein [Rhizobium halophytocola]MBP1852773.1 hypothetical protein [Rhizobium halophytocola]